MEQLSPLEWAMRPLKRYADFKGRASRSEYWWFWLISMLFNVLIQILARVSPIFGLLGIIYLGVIIPMIAVSVRRLHDIGRSGFWLLAPLVPYALGFAGMVSASATNGGTPAFGVMAPAVVLLILGALLAIVLLIFTILPGTKGPNRFGPDPHDEQNLEEIFT